jgi:hypothetical protein
MPIKLYGSDSNEDSGRAFATIHVAHKRRMLVIDTYLIDFDDAIEEIGILQRVTASNKDDHNRYFIKVDRETTMEDAARKIAKELAEIAREVIDMGEIWDLWK